MSDVIEEKLKEGLPLIVDFGSSTCIPCKMIKPVLEQLAEEYAGKVNIMILDVYEHMELAQKFGIMSVPTQLFYDADGKLLGNHIGFLDKDSLREIIKDQFSVTV